VRGVEHMWPECHVPLNACVIRFWNKKTHSSREFSRELEK
jgi:hypothetical protein